MVAEPAPGFVGRERELELLSAALAEAATARAVRCVVVEGEAGIGKSSLLRTFLTALPGPTVLATAEAAEELVDHALADQLLRAAGVERPGVLAAGGAGAPPGLATVGLRLLEAFADGVATVVAVDDAQWADAASLRALLFAVRRMTEEPLLLVLGVRAGLGERIPDGFRKLDGGSPPVARRSSGAPGVDLTPRAPLPVGPVRAIALGGLTSEQVGALAGSVGVALSGAAARRLRDHAGGNPLYIRALLGELPASAWEEGELSPPAPELFARHALRRLDAAGDPTRALIEAAAVLGVRSELSAAAAVARGADAVGAATDAGADRAANAATRGTRGRGGASAFASLDALEEAQRIGLLALAPDGRAIVFDHPLTRAAVYHAIGPARRARLHTAAARVIGHRGLELRHRAAAATGADPALAAELEAFARGETLRNAWESAAESLAAAARLCDGAERERLEIDSADALLGAGRPGAARARLGERGEAGAQLLCVLALLAFHEGRLDEAERLLALGWEREDAAQDVRWRIAERRAVLALARMRPDEALAWADSSAALAPGGAVERLLANWPRAAALSAAGEHRQALAVLDRILSEGGEIALGDRGFRAMRGRLRLAGDDVTGALEELRAATAPHGLGAEQMAAAANAWLARAELAAGAWDAAALHAERARSLATADDGAFARAEAFAAAFAVALLRGDLDAAAEHADALRAGAAIETARATSLAADAALAAATSRSADALAATTELRALLSSGPGARDSPTAGGAGAGAAGAGAAGAGAASAAGPAAARLRELQIPVLEADALVRAGRIEEAEAVLAPEEAHAAEHGPRSLAAALARVRGRLEEARGRHEEAERAYARALDGATAAGMPYELALSQLALGGHLRRRGQRRRAVDLLEQARETFARLGAAPDLERCERELEASGLSPARRGEADRSALTARERAVAQLAADGLTNREIAAELLVSAKTIEVHLTRVFAKLDVSARTELPARLD